MEPSPSADSKPHDVHAPEPQPEPEESSQTDPSPVSSSAAVTHDVPSEAQPTYVFFAIVAAITLLIDIATKVWAEVVLTHRNPLKPAIVVIEDHLQFRLAYNEGGAWGLFQSADEAIRKPFFFIVSIVAVAFIVSLYGRITVKQHALKWGLPLVLGGALGNLTDRIVRGSVVDFIDYRADWVGSMNAIIAKVFSSWDVWDHWPTFNIADVAICIGVGLMAVDMFTAKQRMKEEAADQQAADQEAADQEAADQAAAGQQAAGQQAAQSEAQQQDEIPEHRVQGERASEGTSSKPPQQASNQ